MYIADDNVRPEVIKRISSFFTTARNWDHHALHGGSPATHAVSKIKQKEKKKKKKGGEKRKKKKRQKKKIVVNRVIWFINDNERAEGNLSFSSISFAKLFICICIRTHVYECNTFVSLCFASDLHYISKANVLQLYSHRVRSSCCKPFNFIYMYI